MKVPNLSQCESLMQEYGVPENVKAHVDAVRRVANFLAKKISGNKEVDLECVDKAALMHDFLKLYCIKNNCRHANEAGKILSGRGFVEFGEIVKLHGLEEVMDFNSKTPLEAKIVWYSDKRVNNGQIVSLGKRYLYLKGRYGSLGKENLNGILATEKHALKLEKELLKLANVSEKLEGLNG